MAIINNFHDQHPHIPPYFRLNLWFDLLDHAPITLTSTVPIDNPGHDGRHLHHHLAHICVTISALPAVALNIHGARTLVGERPMENL